MFKNPSPAFLKVLAETGPVPGLDEKKRKSEADDSGLRKKVAGGWSGKPADMERLATGIEQLAEDDLFFVVKLILDNQTQDTYVQSNVDGTLPFKDNIPNMLEGEFQFDLYTLGNNVLSQLWEYTRKKVDL